MTRATPTKREWNGSPSLRKLLVPIGLLAPHPDNPRKHDLPTIKASLEALGQQKPIVVVPPGRVHPEFQTIVAGHGTTLAARELGWTHIAAVESDLADEDIARFVLADNRSSDLGRYDDERLAKLLGRLDEDGGLAGTGYVRDDLDSLLAEIAYQARRREKDPDETPDVPTEARSRVGEVYELGEHKVWCGDALDAVAAGFFVGTRCVLTDPPYGANLNPDWSGMVGSPRGKQGLPRGKKYRPVIGDDQPFDAAPYAEAFAAVKEQFWFGADYYRRTLSDDDREGSWLVWDKRNENSDAGFGSGFELIWSRQQHKRDLLRFYYFGTFGADAARRVHPTQKPVPLLREILERWAPKGKPVADPFAGSGSILMACEQTSRPCLTVEIDPLYCDVIRQRYADFVGDPDLAPQN